MGFSRRLTDVKELGAEFKLSLREFPSYVIIATVAAYSLDLFGIRVYPFAQGERRLTTFFPAPLEGTETSFSVTFSCILLYIRSS